MPKHQKSTCWNLGMSVLILVSNGAIQRSNRICSQDQSKISPKFVKINPKHQKSTCWNLGRSVLILVSNGAIQRSNRICSQDQSKISPKIVKISPKHQKSTCWNLGMSVLILVSNGDIQRSFRICSHDQHADLGHISLGQQPILATMSWNVRDIVRRVRNVRNIPGPWEHCSGTT